MSTFEGKEELFRKLRSVIPTAENRLRGAIETGAGEIVGTAKSLAPVEQGDLRDSIQFDMMANDEGRSRLKAIITAGDEKAFYARWVEFGTKDGVPAQPFFFSAYRLLRKRVFARISRALSRAVKETASK